MPGSLILLPRRRVRAPSGKSTTESRPATTRAAPVAGLRMPSSIPMPVVATMNGREVACSSAAASTPLVSTIRPVQDRGQPAGEQQGEEEDRHRGERRPASGEERSHVELYAADDEEERDKHAEADRFELLAEEGVRHHPVFVHQPQDRARDKGSEYDLEPQKLRQDGEAHQEQQGAADPDLGARVLKTQEDGVKPCDVFELGDRDPYGTRRARRRPRSARTWTRRCWNRPRRTARAGSRPQNPPPRNPRSPTVPG